MACKMHVVKDAKMRMRAKKLVGDIVRADDRDTQPRKVSKPNHEVICRARVLTDW